MNDRYVFFRRARVRGFLQTVAALLLPAVSLQAEDGYFSMFTDSRGASAGRTVYTFLTLPVGARMLALGSAAWPASGDATDIPTAPASTAFMDRYHFAVTHLEWLMGLRKEFAGACIPILDVGTLGFYSRVFTYGGFDNARDIEEQPAEIRAVDYSIGASFSRRFLSDRLAAGVTMSYVQSILAGEPAASVSCDLDLLYIPSPRLSARVVGRHLGSPAVYADAVELQPAEGGVSLRVSPFGSVTDDNDESPVVPPLVPEAAVGVLKTADGPVRAGVGLELRIVDQFFVRTGYEYSLGQAVWPAGISAGVGLTLGQCGIDAGWKNQSHDFGSVWSATVRYTTEEIHPKSAMEYYLIGEKHYQKGRNRQAIRYGRKALELNPNLWQAHSLLARTTSRFRREKGSEIGLVYSGNFGGNLFAKPPEAGMAGGIARAATAVRSLRAEYPYSLALEAGNLIGASTSPEAAHAALTYIARAGFDVQGVGKGEVDLGLDRYRDEDGIGPPNAVCTNLSRLGGVHVSDAALLSIGERNIAVLGAIDPFLWPAGEGTLRLAPLSRAIADRLKTASVRNCNLRILLFHGSWQTLQELLADVPGIDIVICGSQEQRFEQPMMLGSSIVLSAGAGGQYVGALTLRFGDQGQVISYDNRLIPLSGSIVPDAEVQQAAERARPDPTAHTVDTLLPDMLRANTEGLLALVSDRSGTPHVYLKSLQYHAEFPLTSGTAACGRPRFSPRSHRLVYEVVAGQSDHGEMYIADLQKGDPLPLGVAGRVDEVRFHPAGQWVYLVVTPPGDTAAAIRRTIGPGQESQPVVAQLNTSARWLDFSPDGASIVYSAIVGPYWHLFVADTAGATPIQITEQRGNHIDARISPDGRYLAYRSDRSGLTGRFDLWVLDRETGSEARLTASSDVEEYCWYGDSRTLVFGAGSPRTLHAVNISTGTRTPLTHRKRLETYDEMSPHLLRVNGEERIVYVRSYRSERKRLHWIKIDGSDDRRISESAGSEWLE